jgi:hypothetical protein
MVKERQISGLAISHNISDKIKVAKFLRISFSELENKNNGWNILLKFSKDSNLFVKMSSINAIRPSFVYIPNKEEAWKCLLDLLQEQNEEIRKHAAVSISIVFIHLPDKEKGWMDLLEIVKTSTEDRILLPLIIIPKCFEQLDDKEKIITSLEELVNHNNVLIRSYSNNLLGRIYITKSVKLKSDAFNELYFKGIDHLKKSYDDFDIPPHKFCYIMHNTFSKIIEGEIVDKNEIVDNIDELKSISKESDEKTKIIQILDDLYTILEETLETQQKGEDILQFKDRIIPICIQLNGLIGTLNNEIIRSIAEKAQEKIHFEYNCTIKALKIVDDLIESPKKLTSEPSLILDTIRLCCLSISEPVCNHYKSKLEEIEKKDIGIDEKETLLLQLIQELKPVLEQEKSFKEIFVSGQREIKTELTKVTERLENCVISINRTGPRQEVVISTGVEMFGTGGKIITTIPLNEIGYDELHDDILRIKNKMPLAKTPSKLKTKILEFIKIKELNK